MAAIRPESETELVESVRQALTGNTPLEVVGTGTKRGLGHPMQTAATLDMTGFSAISLYEPEELVITAGAGAKVADVSALLSSKGQAFAFEPPDLSRLMGSDHAGTLGGMLACNLSGPRRFKAGAARDHILGVAGVSGRGEAFKAGGRVVKNVTGYDLPKLMAGSYGTLAALTSLTFKILPRAESEETLVVEGLSDQEAVAAMSLALQSSCEVSGAAHLPENLTGGKARTLLRLEGIPASVAYRRDKLARLLAPKSSLALATEPSRDAWTGIRDVHAFAGDRSRIVWRLSVPPAKGAEITAAFPKDAGLRWFYDWGGGLIWLDMPPGENLAALMRTGLREGHATLIRASEPLRASVPVFSPQSPALAALAIRVKAAFDPNGLFNPGRMQEAS